jgi:hypothetical protein
MMVRVEVRAFKVLSIVHQVGVEELGVERWEL